MEIIGIVMFEGLEVNEVDFEDVVWSEARVIATKTINGHEYDMIVVDGELYAVDTYDPFEVSAEDYLEWCAASVGMNVQEYTGDWA